MEHISHLCLAPASIPSTAVQVMLMISIYHIRLVLHMHEQKGQDLHTDLEGKVNGYGDSVTNNILWQGSLPRYSDICSYRFQLYNVHIHKYLLVIDTTILITIPVVKIFFGNDKP